MSKTGFHLTASGRNQQRYIFSFITVIWNKWALLPAFYGLSLTAAFIRSFGSAQRATFRAVIVFLWFPSKSRQLSWSSSSFQETLVTALSGSFCGFAGTFAVPRAFIWLSLREGYSSAEDPADRGGSGGGKTLTQRLVLQAVVKLLSLCGKTGKHCGSHLLASSIRGVFTTPVSADGYLVLSTSRLRSECKGVHPPSGSVVFCCRGLACPEVSSAHSPLASGYRWENRCSLDISSTLFRVSPRDARVWAFPYISSLWNTVCSRLQSHHTVSSHNSLSAAATAEPL